MRKYVRTLHRLKNDTARCCERCHQLSSWFEEDLDSEQGRISTETLNELKSHIIELHKGIERYPALVT